MDGVDRFQAGDVEVICLVDGAKVFGAEVFPSLTEETRAARLAAAGLTEAATEFNSYLLRHPGGIDLVDAGCGTLFGDGAGFLPERLAALGLRPGDIDRLILTHLHGDHVGGALTQDSGLAYPQAEVLMHRAEAAHWQGRDAPGGRFLSLTEPTLIEDGADLGQGITLWHLPGHTPGHSGLRIGDLALVTDIVHSEALQLPDPACGPTFDVDGALAAETRAMALACVAAEGLVWSGAHILGPGKFHRLARDGDGFARAPL